MTAKVNRYYWVGLETDSSPHGHGEDYREYVTANEDNKGERLQAAVLRIAAQLTNMDDGDRIAIRGRR
jgi:hypothetical protein